MQQTYTQYNMQTVQWINFENSNLHVFHICLLFFTDSNYDQEAQFFLKKITVDWSVKEFFIFDGT
jgi:hypothetical protein